MHFLPPNGALHGTALDHLLRLNLNFVFGLFIAAHILIVAAFLSRRAHNADPSTSTPTRKNTLPSPLILEALTLVAVTALYIAMDITGHRLWAASREQNPTSHPIEVEVNGVQFDWYFRYPPPDGLYGLPRPSLVSAPTGNPLGLDRADPHAADDIVSSILIL